MKKSFKYSVIIALHIGISLSTSVHSAEVVLDGDNHVWIIGEIKPGDARRFDDIVGQQESVGYVTLASTGGDLIEAMIIGRSIREKFIRTRNVGGITKSNRCDAAISVSAGNKTPMTSTQEQSDCACYSACFVIWAGGAIRDGRASDVFDYESGGLGIHRPRFDSNYFSGLSAKQAAAEYGRLVELTKTYFRDMDVPSSLIEKMFSVSSSDIYQLSQNDVKSLQMSPAIAEWLNSKCGELTADETEDRINLQYDVAMNNASEIERNYFHVLWKKYSDIIICQRSAIDDEQRSRQATLEPMGNIKIPTTNWDCETEEAGSATMSVNESHIAFRPLDGEEMILPRVGKADSGWITGAVDAMDSRLSVRIRLDPMSGKTIRELVVRNTGEITYSIEGTCTPIYH